MAFLCPSRVGQTFGKSKPKAEKPWKGRITGSDSVDTLVRVGLEKQHGLPPSSYRIIKDNFVPAGGREVAVQKGEGIYILYVENEWTYIIKKNGLEGFVPSTFCQPPNETDARFMLSSSPTSSLSQIDSNNNNGKEKYKFVTGNNDSFDAFKGGLPDMANGYNIGATTENIYSTPRTEGDVRSGPNSSVKKLENLNQTTKLVVSDDINEERNMKTEMVPFRKTSHGQFIVLFDFEAQEENDVTVERAEIVNVLNIEDPDWSWVKRYHGEEGFVPKAYICPVEPLKAQERLQRQRNKINSSFGSSSASSLSLSLAPKTRKPIVLKPSPANLQTDFFDSPFRLRKGLPVNDSKFPVTSSPKNTPDHAKILNRYNERPYSSSTPNLAINSLPTSLQEDSPSYDNHLLGTNKFIESSSGQMQNLHTLNSPNCLPLSKTASGDHVTCISQGQMVRPSQQLSDAEDNRCSISWNNSESSIPQYKNSHSGNSTSPTTLTNDKTSATSAQGTSVAANNCFKPKKFTEKSTPTCGPIVKPKAVLMPISTDSNKIQNSHTKTIPKSVSFQFYDGPSDIEDDFNSSFECQMEEQLSITDFNLSIIRKNDTKSITNCDRNDEKLQPQGPIELPVTSKKPKVRIPKPKPKLDDSMISDITEFVLLYDYKARSMNDLSANQGEKVFSDAKTNCNDDWVWAYSPETSKYGFVPRVYLGQANQTVV